jgi:hypothetical protein
LDLQGQRFVHGGDRSGNNHCPEKMHYIQGAGDLLNEMRCMASGARGKCKAAPRDWYCTLEEGARFKVEVNGGVPVHIDESLDNSPSTDLCSPFDVRTCRCNNRTTPGAGPSKAAQKQLKSQKKNSKPPWSRPKRGGAGHPTSVAQIGVGGLCIGQAQPALPTSAPSTAISIISKVVVVYYCCCGGPGAYGAHRRRRC